MEVGEGERIPGRLGLPRTALAWAAAFFLAGMVVRLAFWLYYGSHVSPDAITYLSMCERMPLGISGVMQRVGLESIGFVSVLCGFLGIPGMTVKGWILVQIILSSGTCALAYAIAHRLFGPIAGILAGIPMVLLWDMFQWDVYVLSDTLFTFLVALAVFALAFRPAMPATRGRVLLGTTVILMAVTRPFGMPILLGWILWDLFPRSSGKRIGVVPHPAIAGAIAALLVGLALAGQARFGGSGPGIVDYWSRGMVMWHDDSFDYSYHPNESDTTLGFALRNLHHLAIMAAIKVAVFFLPVVDRFSILHNAMNLVTLAPVLFLGLAGAGVVARRERVAARLLLMPVVMTLVIVGITFLDFDWRFRAPVLPLFAILSGRFLIEITWVRRAVQRFLQEPMTRFVTGSAGNNETAAKPGPILTRRADE